MSIIAMQVFVSLMLVAGALLLFIHSVCQRDFDHADRLSLAPLDDDASPSNQTEEKESCRHDKSSTTTP